MTFSTEWDECYTNQTHLSTWPWSDMISYVMRYARPNKPDYQVLELGCGAGANIPFFLSLGVKYSAIEGSMNMVSRLREKFPQIKENIVKGDFTVDIPFDMNFDLIVDRASLTHNSAEGIVRALDMAYHKLKIGGKYIGIDWFSTLHSDYSKGKEAEDAFTRTGYEEGQFAGVGRVHFSDRSHLQKLFGRFKIVLLQQKFIKTEIPRNDHTFASWNLVAER